MTIETIYKCDKCGSEQSDNKQFWKVGVFASSFNCQAPPYITSVSGKEIQVCRSCLESFGIYVQKKKDEEPPKLPTIEELIGEIIKLYSEL